MRTPPAAPRRRSRRSAQPGAPLTSSRLTCATTSQQPADGESGFAALWEASSFDVVDENGEMIEWNLWADNGTWANPTVQVWIQNNASETPLVTLSRAVTSPAGQSVPGFQSVLRFHVCADIAFDAEFTSIKFDVDAVDNAGSGWSSCGVLAQEVAFDLVNVTAPTTPIEVYQWATTTSNQSCDTVSEDSKLGYVYMEILELVPAGTCSTYEVRLDASGASSAQDDTVRVDIVDEEWLVWFDQNGDGYDGSNADGLPVQGITIQF